MTPLASTTITVRRAWWVPLLMRALLAAAPGLHALPPRGTKWLVSRTVDLIVAHGVRITPIPAHL